jgi:hypothetical protein
MMNHYDLCIIWNWEYDFDFITLVNKLCLSRNLSILQVTPDNLEGLLNSLINQQISFQVFFDRASEDDIRFMPFVRWACNHSKYFINRHEYASRSWDKGVMHYELIHAGIHTPYTIILPSYEEQQVISSVDLTQLGERFVVKPVHGSGGEGVVKDVTSWEQVLELRKNNCSYRYLLQKYIIPRKLDFHLAWFRVLYCTGEIYPCWWNPETHIYKPITAWEERQFGLGELSVITKTIANLSELDLFSSEIAFTEENLFVVIDYVNDQPDFRLQSNAMDGVPDDIVYNIARCLSQLVADQAASPLYSEE